jgi:uncharacterized BrkB/YihY/UPF0761 family membrane protein
MKMTATEFLIILTGYVGVVIVALFAIAVLWQIYLGNIDLAKLVSESDGSASMSRFQFLVFTFVIGFGLILMVVASMKSGTPKLPEVPGGIMALLGISGGTYAVSKGIQKSNESATKPSGTKNGKHST